MQVLIIFDTVEGQTRKIADFVARRVLAEGNSVQYFSAEDKLGDISFDGIDKVVLAAPVHERRHPPGFEVLISTSRAELAARQTLMISVSLKAGFPEGRDEAQDYLTEMKMRTRFEPTQEVLVAGAVRTASYDYFERQVVNNVVLDGRSVALVDGVREFTDWDALAETVDAFLQAPA